jgi:Tol biopolymer transport system component
MIGRVVSHYRIVERIGAGGMGVVYKAEDTKLGRTVALKFLPPELTRDKKAKQRFIQEARAASAMDHANICTIYEVDEIDDGQLFIAMACYQGKTLKDRIAEGRLELAEILEISAQITRGLAKAHAQGIVHRDIKPGNIFLTHDGEVKIVDFGLAKLAGQVKLTSTGKTMGTVAYMSPEQARGGETGPRTDIWALGVLLYEMVTGEIPFKGDYDVAVVYSIMSEAPAVMSSLRPEIPEELESIVKKALAKSESDRYQGANEILSDLSALKRQLDFTTFKGVDAWKFKGKDRRRLFALGAVFIAAAAIAGVWLLSANRGKQAPSLPGKPSQVTSGDFWHGDPALSPDGGTIAYAADESGNKDLYVINVGGGNPLRLTDDPAADYYPAWYPDGSALAFVSERGGSKGIWKIGKLGGGATLLLNDAVDPAISPDGRRIAFRALLPNGEERIGVAPLTNTSDVTVLTRSTDGAWEHRKPAWSPDGESICYGTRPDLWIVSASGGPARRLTKDTDNALNPAWSNDGRHVYFSSGREGTIALWRVSSKGGRAERLTTGSSHEGDPTVSPDGSRFAYSTETEPGTLLLRDLESGRETKIPGIRDICIAAIAPDGSKIVYASDRGGPKYDLWLQLLDHGIPSGQPQRLTEDTADAACPAFSPDGKWVVYHRILGEQRDIFTIPAAGGKPMQFTDDPAQDTQPAWSPDGSMIVFASNRAGPTNIWAAPVSEGKPAGPPRRVTKDTMNVGAPVWSGDGDAIIYIGETSEGTDVWMIPADGSTPARRITRGARALMARWDGATGSLLVSGRWKEDQFSIRRISIGGKAVPTIDPPVEFGSLTTVATFDVSYDGRLVVYSRAKNIGNIWMHEAKKGTF